MSWILRTFETWYCSGHGGWYGDGHFGGECSKP